jgi:hypothetical protein
VYAAYLARKEQAPGLVCQIGRLRFKPEDRIIDRDQRLDVATFRIGEVEVERTAKWLHRPSSWPPVPPEEGRGVFLAGFARTLRDEKEEAVTFGSVSLLLTATTIGNDTITCQFDRENFVDMGSGLPPQPMSLEGVSGAPLWTLVDRPVVGWRLAGVVIEYNTAFELLIVRRADCITANGRLLR